MKDLFFIVKGQYRKKTSPLFTDIETGTTYSVGGYNPESENTIEHYQLMDNITFKCLACGSYEEVLESVYTHVKRYKGDTDKYLKGVEAIPPVSKAELKIRKKVLEWYGDYFKKDIEKQVDIAMSDLVNSHYKKAKKLVRTLRPHSEKTPRKVDVLDSRKPKRNTTKKIRINVLRV